MSFAAKVIARLKGRLRRSKDGWRSVTLRLTVMGSLLVALLGGVLGAVNRGLVGGIIGTISGLLAGGASGLLAACLYNRGRGEVKLWVELDRAKESYAPGDTISGYAHLEADGSAKVSGGSMYLVCRGIYLHGNDFSGDERGPLAERTSRPYYSREKRVIPELALGEHSSHRYAFGFTLPDDALPSNRGYIYSVRWNLYGVLDGLEDRFVKEEVLVEEAPRMLESRADGYQVHGESEILQLAMRLPYADVAEGEAVAGQLRILPKEDFHCSELRVVLLRIESVRKGNGSLVYVTDWDAESGKFRGTRRPGPEGTTYVWPEGEQVLERETDCRMGHVHQHDFRLSVPHEWRPSLQTDEGQVRWQVAAVVTPSDFDKVRIAQLLRVHTASPKLGRVLTGDTAVEREQ